MPAFHGYGATESERAGFADLAAEKGGSRAARKFVGMVYVLRANNARRRIN